MQILAFYPYVPYPLDRGAYYRAYYLLRHLAEEHEVDVLALSENGEGLPHAAIFQEFCRKVEVVPFEHPPWPTLLGGRLFNPLPATVAHWTLPEARASVQRLLRDCRYDAVHLFDSILAQYFLVGDQNVPVVLDRTRVDLQYQLMERRRRDHGLKSRLLGWESLLKLWRYERQVANRVSLQIVCGPDDAAFTRRSISKRVPLAVIPNGVDTSYFHPPSDTQSERAPEPTVLFCGAMDYRPNVDALLWYFEEIHPGLVQLVPELRVWIVGKDPVREVREFASVRNVTVTGGVPDVRPYYRRAWLQIVPLRIGGGTRLKIVECMAMGTPVISTTIGAQGLPVEHGRDILLADTADAFVRETAQLLKSGQRRDAVAEAGLVTVRTHLAWPVLGRQLVEVYAKRFTAGPLSDPLLHAPAAALRADASS